MARRVVTLNKLAPTLAVPAFGDSAFTLRVTQHVHGLDGHQNARVVASVNTGVAPDPDLATGGDGTFVLSPAGLPSEFTESVPATAWDVRLEMISQGDAPQNVVVEMEEF